MSFEQAVPAVRFDGVTKIYRLYRDAHHRILDQIGLGGWRARAPVFKDFHALQDVDLSIAKGERVGIIGRNGAGKTTLLKLVTGNFSPTHGAVRVDGTVQALMQVGLGFHPEFSGYENLRSALLYNRLSGGDLEAALADVVDFVELGEFLHQPVKTYSQGMQARLNFGAATAIQPDILIVDEVMGAGDAYFVAKSAARIKRLTATGCTLLLVSHSAHQVLEFCDKALWLHEGKVRMFGDAEEIVGCYEVYIEREYAARANPGAQHDEHVRGDDPHARFTEILPDGHPIFRWPSRRGVKINGFRMSPDPGATTLHTGAAAGIELDLIVEADGDYGCSYFITIWDAYGKRIARVESPVDSFTAKAGDTRSLRCDITPLILGAGDYVISFSVYDRKSFSSTTAGAECRFDIVARCISFSVTAPTAQGHAIFTHPAAWSFGRQSPEHEQPTPGKGL